MVPVITRVTALLCYLHKFEGTLKMKRVLKFSTVKGDLCKGCLTIRSKLKYNIEVRIS